MSLRCTLVCVLDWAAFLAGLRSLLGRVGRSRGGLGLRQTGLRGCRQFVNAARQGGERIVERLGLRFGGGNAAGKSCVGARWALQRLLDPIEPA